MFIESVPIKLDYKYNVLRISHQSLAKYFIVIKSFPILLDPKDNLLTEVLGINALQKDMLIVSLPIKFKYKFNISTEEFIFNASVRYNNLNLSVLICLKDNELI